LDGGDSSSDLTALPGAVDTACEKLAPDVRPTIVTPGEEWTKKAWGALLARKPTTAAMGRAQQKEAKAEALDLLDALTRSGALPLASAALHVVVCGTQSFEGSVVDTVVKRNVNPIEKAERAALVLAHAVHAHGAAASGGGPPSLAGLVSRAHAARATAANPALFPELGASEEASALRAPDDLLGLAVE
jgi:hypothetical protein